VRLFDQVMADEKIARMTLNGTRPARLVSLAQDRYVPFDGTPVFEWWHSQPAGKVYDLSEMGPAVPPFPLTWFEWDCARVAPSPPTDGLSSHATEFVPEREAVLLITTPLEGGGWRVKANFLLKVGGQVMAPIFGFRIWLDEDGVCLRQSPEGEEGTTLNFDCPALEGVETASQDALAVAELERRASNNSFFLALLCCAFANCKNITIGTEPPRHTTKAVRRKLNGKPLVQFKTIDLPRTGRKRADGRDEINDGGPVPLHMVRGHFKTYTEDNPLLGKHVGTYWWSHHARGDLESGVVVSDYRVGR
jgi:hypothetical protein